MIRLIDKCNILSKSKYCIWSFRTFVIIIHTTIGAHDHYYCITLVWPAISTQHNKKERGNMHGST